MLMLEVRCCCDPARLLGFMPIEEARIAYPQRQLSYNIINTQALTAPTPTITYTRQVVLELAQISIAGKLGIAIKSNDHAIEILRCLPGFKEATEEERNCGSQGAISRDGCYE